jgi:signal transduction histidine kinase
VHEDVPDLVERARDSGMTITLTLPAGEVPALAHAVVQEGLTNAAKHAPGAAVEVVISPHRVAVRNGPPRGRPTATPGGLGLAALTERVRLAGGTLTANPSGDGYELVAKLP